MSDIFDSNVAAGAKADSLLATEVAIQDKMWGLSNERAAADKSQMIYAAAAQLLLTVLKVEGITSKEATTLAKASFYPTSWDGFRDYGTEDGPIIANLVVAGAFIRSEIKRRLLAGEGYDRAPRPKTETYPERNTPNVSSVQAISDGPFT